MSDEENEDKEPLGVKFDRKLDKEEQIDVAEKLQTLLLHTYLRRLEAGRLSDTGLAALQRLLHANGWSLDPSQLPKNLRDKLTSNVSPEELDEQDNVLPFPRAKQA